MHFINNITHFIVYYWLIYISNYFFKLQEHAFEPNYLFKNSFDTETNR